MGCQNMTADPRGPVWRRAAPPAVLRQHETSGRRDRPGRFAAGSGEFCKRYPGQETGVRAGPPARYRRDEVDRLLGDLDFPAPTVDTHGTAIPGRKDSRRFTRSNKR